MVVLLDNIRSLHNVGSIFRTADAVGVEKLYLCGITPTPRDRFGEVPLPLAKVALGAEKTVAWEKVAISNSQCRRWDVAWSIAVEGHLYTNNIK